VHKFTIVSRGQGCFLDDPEPHCAPGQVLCKPISVGICGSDRLIFAGEMPAVAYPRVPCHEVAATVVLDKSQLGLVPGTWVCVDPYKSCGRCHACQLGRLQLLQD